MRDVAAEAATLLALLALAPFAVVMVASGAVVWFGFRLLDRLVGWLEPDV